ncbi:MAG: glycosyltransferase family 2 protein [bacterium]|nr:glycosyltransferase family 2 protein [bacterium]
MSSISVVVATYNEEENIEDCLKSVKWADEIIVIDDCSTDKTADIAKRYTDKVIVRKHEGPEDAWEENKNYGFSIATGDWILILDADERVPPELASEIKSITASNPEYNGYWVRKNEFYFGIQLKHIAGDTVGLRLFKKGKGKFTCKRVHEQLLVEGKVGILNNPMLHFAHHDISSFISSTNKYTTYEAGYLFNAGVKTNCLKMVVTSLRYFYFLFFKKRGFLDGQGGFIAAVLKSFYQFVKHAKLWELYKDAKNMNHR